MHKVDNCLNSSLSYFSKGIGYVEKKVRTTLPSAICGAIAASAYGTGTNIARGFAQGAVFALTTDLMSEIRARVNDPNKVQNRDGVAAIKVITVIGQIALPIILFSLTDSLTTTSTTIASYATPYIPTAISNLGAYFVPAIAAEPDFKSTLTVVAAALAPKYFSTVINACKEGYKGFKEEYYRTPPPPQQPVSSTVQSAPKSVEVSTTVKIVRSTVKGFAALIGGKSN